MTHLRRIKQLEKYHKKLNGWENPTIITVSPVLWEKDKDGHPITRVPYDAIYKDREGKVIVKDECGIWRYEDGWKMPVTGIMIFMNGAVRP